MRKYRLKGQSLLEYAFLVAIVAAAFIGMQHYIKRSVQGRVKQAADQIAEPYDPQGMRISTLTTQVIARSTVNTTPRVLNLTENWYAVDSHVTVDENVAKSGNEQLNPW